MLIRPVAGEGVVKALAHRIFAEFLSVMKLDQWAALVVQARLRPAVLLLLTTFTVFSETWVSPLVFSGAWLACDIVGLELVGSWVLLHEHWVIQCISSIDRELPSLEDRRQGIRIPTLVKIYD